MVLIIQVDDSFTQKSQKAKTRGTSEYIIHETQFIKEKEKIIF